MATKFVVGQRVIVTANNIAKDIHTGYYGHVERIDTPATNPVLRTNLYFVHLKGRAGAEAAPWMLNEPWFNPFGFFESELEAAD